MPAVVRWLINWLWNKHSKIGQSESDNKFLIETYVVICPTKVHNGWFLPLGDRNIKTVNSGVLQLLQHRTLLKILSPFFFLWTNQGSANIMRQRGFIWGWVIVISTNTIGCTKSHCYRSLPCLSPKMNIILRGSFSVQRQPQRQFKVIYRSRRSFVHYNGGK